MKEASGWDNLPHRPAMVELERRASRLLERSAGAFARELLGTGMSWVRARREFRKTTCLEVTREEMAARLGERR